MSVSAPSSATNSAASAAAYSSTVTRAPKQALDSNDFMKLLAVQFQQQDPMKPMDDTAFISQMAQFSALQQSNTTATEMGLLRSDQQNASATGMLGRTVTVSDKDGLPVIGQVSAVVNTESDGPALVVNGQQYLLNAVQRVELTPATVDLPPAA